jgi:hypothetical protein
MTDSDLIEMYEALANLLREARLGWIAENVDEELRSGILEAKSGADLLGAEAAVPSPGIEPAPRRGLRKAEFMVARVPTPKERVLTLIDALEQTVVVAPSLEDTIAGHLKEFGLAEGFEFRPTEGETGSALVFDRRSSESRWAASLNLKRLLDQLRSEKER